MEERQRQRWREITTQRVWLGFRSYTNAGGALSTRTKLSTHRAKAGILVARHAADPFPVSASSYSLITNNVSPATLAKQRSWGFGRAKSLRKCPLSTCQAALRIDLTRRKKMAQRLLAVYIEIGADEQPCRAVWACWSPSRRMGCNNNRRIDFRVLSTRTSATTSPVLVDSRKQQTKTRVSSSGTASDRLFTANSRLALPR